MLIKPNNNAQAVKTRCRPHEEMSGYLFIAWQESSRVYPFLSDLIYEDGHLIGNIEVPIPSLKNGMQLTTVIYPIIDAEAIVEAIESLRPQAPYFAASEILTALIAVEINLMNLLPEIYRGTIFVQTQDNQPFGIT